MVDCGWVSAGWQWPPEPDIAKIYVLYKSGLPRDSSLVDMIKDPLSHFKYGFLFIYVMVIQEKTHSQKD
jgi:hypothetical protein